MVNVANAGIPACRTVDTFTKNMLFHWIHESDNVNVGLLCIAHSMRLIKQYYKTLRQVNNLTIIIYLL